MAGEGKKPRQADARVAVSRNLVRVRELFDLNRKRFADGFGVGDTLWRRWEMGRNYPDPDVMVALCDRSGATMDFLYRSRLSGLPEWMIRALLEKHPDLGVPVGAGAPRGKSDAIWPSLAAPAPDLPKVGRRPRRKKELQDRPEQPTSGLFAVSDLHVGAELGGPTLGAAAAAPDQPEARRRQRRKARPKFAEAQVPRK